MIKPSNNNSQKLKEFMSNNLSEIYNNLSSVYDPDEHALTVGDFLGSWVTRESLRDYAISGSDANKYMPSEFDIERASDVLFDGGILVFEDISIDEAIFFRFGRPYPSTFVYLQDGAIKYYHDTCEIAAPKWNKEEPGIGILIDIHERTLFLLNLLNKDKDITKAYNDSIGFDSGFHKFYETAYKTSYINIRSAGLTYEDFLLNHISDKQPTES